MKWPETRYFDLQERTILAGYVGSHSHGTYISPKLDGIDDKDIMGICVPPINYYLGLQKFEQIQTWVDEYDIVIYECRKFISLLLKSNPNVFSLLWLQPNLYVKMTDEGRTLIENKSIFSSKKAYKSFVGYAHSQLSSMERFNHNGFMGAKRKCLVEKFGYDTKNAAHLIRLLRMGIEFLATGELNVLRHDAKQLIDIKQGLYPLEKIKEMSDSLFEDARKALIESSLPDEPDYSTAEKLLVDILMKKNGKNWITHS